MPGKNSSKGNGKAKGKATPGRASRSKKGVTTPSEIEALKAENANLQAANKAMLERFAMMEKRLNIQEKEKSAAVNAMKMQEKEGGAVTSAVIEGFSTPEPFNGGGGSTHGGITDIPSLSKRKQAAVGSPGINSPPQSVVKKNKKTLQYCNVDLSDFFKASNAVVSIGADLSTYDNLKKACASSKSKETATLKLKIVGYPSERYQASEIIMLQCPVNTPRGKCNKIFHPKYTCYDKSHDKSQAQVVFRPRLAVVDVSDSSTNCDIQYVTANEDVYVFMLKYGMKTNGSIMKLMDAQFGGFSNLDSKTFIGLPKEVQQNFIESVLDKVFTCVAVANYFNSSVYVRIASVSSGEEVETDI